MGRAPITVACTCSLPGIITTHPGIVCLGGSLGILIAGLGVFLVLLLSPLDDGIQRPLNVKAQQIPQNLWFLTHLMILQSVLSYQVAAGSTLITADKPEHAPAFTKGSATHAIQNKDIELCEKSTSIIDLCDPLSEAMTSPAPSRFNTTIETSEGSFVITVLRSDAPTSADRFFNLMRHGYYDHTAFYRVIPNFVVQFGPSAHPALSKIYQNNCLSAPSDWPPCATPGACFWIDNVKRPNLQGTVAFSTDSRESVCSCLSEAQSGSRTDLCGREGKLVGGSELFINLSDNSDLDSLGFAPFGKIAAIGMDVVSKLHETEEMNMAVPGAQEADLNCHRSDVQLGCIYAKGRHYLSGFTTMSTIVSVSISH